MTLTLRTSVVGCLLSAAAIAQAGSTQWQTTQMQGMFSTAAVGIVSDSPSGTSELLIRSSGTVTTPPAAWDPARFGLASPYHPDYSMPALLLGFNQLPHGPVDADTIGFGGISTGGDVCPGIDATGRLMLVGSWYFLSVTVGGMPAGHQYGMPNSAIRSLAKPEQAIISYYFEGSTGISTTLVDSTAVEQTGTQLGFSPTSTATVAGVDWGIGAISVDSTGVRSAGFTPVRNRLYFTVTNAWLATHPGFLVDDPSSVTGLSPLNARTVYVMQWLPSLSWAKPEIAYTEAELFGFGDLSAVEIDALSVFQPSHPWTNANIARVVLSTSPTSGSADQLLAYDRAVMIGQPTPPPAQPMRTAAGNLVSAELGLLVGPGDVDNVTGTCGNDPEGIVNGTVGTPMSNLAPQTLSALGLSVYRSISSDTDVGPMVDRVDLHVTGIDLPPNVNGWVHYEFGFPDPLNFPTQLGVPPAWFTLGAVMVEPGSTTASLVVPGDLGLDLPISLAATLYAVGSSQPLRTSWISVLDY